MKQISKEMITATALDLFESKGYDQVTIQDICAASGITKPTFYHYVESKESLILDLYDQVISDLFQHTYELLTLKSSYEQLVYIFGKLSNETMRFRADLISVLLMSNLKNDSQSFSMRDTMTRLCRTIIEQAQEKGEIRNSSDPAVLYNGIAHMFTGYMTIWSIAKGQSDSFRLFFESMNCLLLVDESLKDLYKKYLAGDEHTKEMPPLS